MQFSALLFSPQMSNTAYKSKLGRLYGVSRWVSMESQPFQLSAGTDISISEPE